jgi:Kef-type K+ transport system membrane component KefB
MPKDPIVFTFFLIFTGAAVLATVAMFARQSLLVAYIALGVLLGPWGSGMVQDPAIFKEVAHIGIMFLLFLLGLDLQPQELLRTLKQSTTVTFVSALLFAVIGFAIGWAFGFNFRENLMIGAAAMLSSTILGVKLLPTTTLHHQRMGAIIISILLLQDLMAIVVLLILKGHGQGNTPFYELALVLLYLPALALFAYGVARYLLVPLLSRFDKIQEYIFLLAIGWCLGMAQLAGTLGLSKEIGAFIAGVALATSPIALFIVQSLKPLRDFFLVMFFFTLGASFKLDMVGQVILPASMLAATLLLLKPVIFRYLLEAFGETGKLSGEVGARLGQISEFSLLIAVLALDAAFISEPASYLIQIAALLTFVVSSYWVVMKYPTPIAVSDELRRD